MKYIGIIGAMQVEIESLLELMKEKKEVLISNMLFYTGKIENTNVVVCVSSEGKVNSAIYAEVMLISFDIYLIINCGVAGTLTDNLNIFDFIIAKDTVYHDFDISSLGYEKGLVLGINKKYIPCDEKYSKLLYKICKQNNKVVVGTVATGDIFVTDENKLNEIKEVFNAIAVDMESASISHVCYFNKVSYVSIKVISDSGSKMEFKEFSNKAAIMLKEVIVNFLKEVGEI